MIATIRNTGLQQAEIPEMASTFDAFLIEVPLTMPPTKSPTIAPTPSESPTQSPFVLTGSSGESSAISQTDIIIASVLSAVVLCLLTTVFCLVFNLRRSHIPEEDYKDYMSKRQTEVIILDTENADSDWNDTVYALNKLTDPHKDGDLSAISNRLSVDYHPTDVVVPPSNHWSDEGPRKSAGFDTLGRSLGKSNEAYEEPSQTEPMYQQPDETSVSAYLSSSMLGVGGSRPGTPNQISTPSRPTSKPSSGVEDGAYIELEDEMYGSNSNSDALEQLKKQVAVTTRTDRPRDAHAPPKRKIFSLEATGKIKSDTNPSLVPSNGIRFGASSSHYFPK